MTRKDFDALRGDPEALRDVVALPTPPTQVQTVEVPAGTHLRMGTASRHDEWGEGGIVQFLLIDAIPKKAFKELEGIRQ